MWRVFSNKDSILFKLVSNNITKGLLLLLLLKRQKMLGWFTGQKLHHSIESEFKAKLL